MLLCSDLSSHKDHSITDLSQFGKGKKSYAVLSLGNDFSHSENYHQKMPPIPPLPSLQKPATWTAQQNRRRPALRVTVPNLTEKWNRRILVTDTLQWTVATNSLKVKTRRNKNNFCQCVSKQHLSQAAAWQTNLGCFFQQTLHEAPLLSFAEREN